ncbi:MAG: transcription elongation factor GreA, partial [Gammaproteobacteria bacterium]
MDKHVMTVKGQDLLRKELKALKSKDRPEIIIAIATARE